MAGIDTDTWLILKEWAIAAVQGDSRSDSMSIGARKAVEVCGEQWDDYSKRAVDFMMAKMKCDDNQKANATTLEKGECHHTGQDNFGGENEFKDEELRRNEDQGDYVHKHLEDNFGDFDLQEEEDVFGWGQSMDKAFDDIPRAGAPRLPSRCIAAEPAPSQTTGKALAIEGHVETSRERLARLKESLKKKMAHKSDAINTIFADQLKIGRGSLHHFHRLQLRCGLVFCNACGAYATAAMRGLGGA